MRPRQLFTSMLSTLIILLAAAAVQAQDIDFCNRFGVLNGKYLNQAPPRLVIYDVNHIMKPSVPIYKVDRNTKSGQYERVDTEALEVGSTLSYKVEYIGSKRQPHLKAIWILPQGFCRS